jgi:hypothetical protein
VLTLPPAVTPTWRAASFPYRNEAEETTRATTTEDAWLRTRC